MARRSEEFEDFVRSHRSRLLHSALLLTAGDRHVAEDLVQSTLLKLYLAWPRVRRSSLDAYARRALVNCFIDHTRRPFQRQERPTETPPEPVVDGAGVADEEQSQLIWQALRDLPPGMRAAVVLRHVEDLSVQETARALSCSEGTVKSQTARGLDKIRVVVSATGRANEGASECTR